MFEKDTRFVCTLKEDVKKFGFVWTLVDTVTGVQYLYMGGGGGTVLVDENGKPLIIKELRKTQ